MLAIASKHLISNNDVFSLDINKLEAVGLGISSEFYDKMTNDINKTNEKIKEIQKSNGIIVGLNTVKSNLALKNVRFKSKNETGQTIDSKYQSTLVAFENAPVSENLGIVNANYIEFSVTSSCIVTAVTVQVNTGNGIQQITIMCYPFSTSTGRIYLPTNSCSCSVGIMTPCSDGASVKVYYGK
jgi:hypothetical protein